MRKTLLLSTATIGLGALACATPAGANPALIVPLAAAAAGGLAIGGAAGAYDYPYYDYQASYAWNGRTQIYAYPPTAYVYPGEVYASTPPVAVYGGVCHIQSQRVPNGSSAEWRNFTVCY